MNDGFAGFNQDLFDAVLHNVFHYNMETKFKIRHPENGLFEPLYIKHIQVIIELNFQSEIFVQYHAKQFYN